MVHAGWAEDMGLGGKAGSAGPTRRLPRWGLPALLVGVSALCPDASAAPARLNLAPLAAVTCSPAAHLDSLKAVTDGNAGSGLVFAVGTKGEGTVTFTFPTPRQIDEVRIRQGERAYYSTAYRLTADQDGDGTFETELAAVAEKAPWGEWAAHRLAPVAIRAVRFESVAGHSEGLRAHPVVGEIEVYGSATVADIKALLHTGVRPTAVAELKPLHLATPLVVGGKAACAILVPDEPQYRELGATLALALGRIVGAAPRVTTTAAEADPATSAVIALGQMLNNPLIERLYWNRYLYLDSLCPGRDGSVIQTVHDPYPWTGGNNVVVLGGSTFAGTRRAVAQFEALLPAARQAGALGHILQVTLPPPDERETGYVIGSREYTRVTLPGHDLTEAETTALLTAEPRLSLLSFQELALQYLLTGETAYLQAGKRVLAAMAHVYQQDPERHPTWPEETNSRFIFAAWDAVEEAPVFTDEERLRYTNMLLLFLHSLVGQTADYGNLEKNDTIIWNHTTFPLLGLYWGGRYFRRYYDCTGMETYLQKAAGAFRGQETSWKPQCDADSYLTLTMGHMIEYALAERQMTFLENGNLQRYADYLMGICDNRGWAAGFGDSGVHRSPAVPDAGVPYAFWYTRDPRYLGYLNAIHDGHWLNPFQQDVTPVPPVQNLGVQCYPLGRQVYDYTARRPYYGEPSGPPNIPFEQAFDKISFRSTLAPQGQYFVLDGYARGKHLHYDGNAILKLTDKGEDWLIDGDYLVRNTTEHNMVSVVCNGRAERLVPECAALLHHADLPTHGFTETLVKDYNGVDWHRHIFWQKGGWIVLIDRLVAVQPGNYTFDCVFKCLDKGGEERVGRNRYRIARGGVLKAGNLGLERARRPDDAGEALAFTRSDSQLQFGASLPVGTYRVTLFAKGSDSSSDSFWLSVDGGDPTAFHLPIDTFGPSSATAAKTAPTPEIPIAAAGEHVLTLTLREGPGPLLDRVVIENTTAAQKRIEFRAVDAPPAGAAPPPLQRRFHIVNADTAVLSTASRVGSSGPIKTLFQRRVARLETEEQVAFLNLLYLDDLGQEKGWSAQAAGTAAVLAQVDRPTLAGVGPLDTPGLLTDAALFCLSTERISLVDATAFRAGSLVLSASAPVAIELDLARAEATVVAARACVLRLGDAPAPVPLEPGRHTLACPVPAHLAEELEAVLVGTVLTSGPAVMPAGAAAKAEPGVRELWRFGDGLDQPETRDFCAADLNGDHRLELLVCSGAELHCYTSTGERLWTFSSTRRLRCVTVADTDGDGQTEVLCGGDDEQFHILDRAGHEKAAHKLVERLVVGQGGSVLPFVNCLAVADLAGDGQKRIIVGCSNSQISAFDSSLRRVWNRDAIYHGVRRVLARDLDGDGRQEILAADHYGSVAIITADGASRSSAYSELGDVCFDVGDLNGDGKLELVNGSSTGTLTAYTYPVSPLFSFNNYGYAVRAVRMLDLDADGRSEVLVASDTGYLYALDGRGEPRWQRDLGAAVLALDTGEQRGVAGPGAAASRFIAVGQRDGTVSVLDSAGETTGRFVPGAAVKLLRCVDLDGDGSDEIIAVDSGNHGVVLALRP